MHKPSTPSRFTVTRRSALVATGALLAGVGARAQSWPTKPIKLVVPWPPGGPTDTGSRITAQYLGERLGQTVVIENRPGASGSIAYQQVLKAPGDGYTFVMLATPTMLAPHLYKSAQFHPVNDLLPVGMVYDLPIVLVVNAASLPKVTDLAGLITEAKARAGKLDYTTAGPGSFGHLSMELLKQQGGFQAQHIAYKGSAPAMNDLLGGQVPVMYADLIAAMPHIESGKIKAIALGSPDAKVFLPKVQAISEQGFAGFNSSSWSGIVVPNGTPAPVVARLDQELKAILAEADTKERMQKIGALAAYQPPAQMKTRLAQEYERWNKVATEKNISA